MKRTPVSPMAGSLRSLFRRPTRSPMWTPEGVFVYPPRCLWSPLDREVIVQEWAQAAKRRQFRDPMGLYVHIPAEVHYVGEFFPSRGSHPYLECLELEADFLKLPEDLPLRTLYVGSGGAGALSSFSAQGIDRLLSWLRSRFRLTALRQIAVEVDAAELSPAKARSLSKNGVDRVVARLPADDGTPAASQRRRAFAEGIRMCRRARIHAVAIDVVTGRPGQGASAADEDVDFALSLAPDSFFLCDYSALGDKPSERRARRVREAMAKACSRARGKEEPNNLQLVHALRFNASILGLGWGAISHIRGRLVYGKAGSCFSYVDSLLRGQGAVYAGSPVDEKGEMRAQLVHYLEDVGSIECSTFRNAFAREPEEAFPREFAAMVGEGRLVKRDERLEVVSSHEEDRYVASLRLYGTDVLKKLTRQAAGGVSLKDLGSMDDTPFADPEAYHPRGRRERAEQLRLNEEGMRLLQKGKPAEAIRRFDQALKADPRDVNALISKAAATGALGDLEAALELYGRVVELNPPGIGALSDVLAARAGVLRRLGRIERAVVDLEKALGAAPADWPRREATRGALFRLLRGRRKGKA